MEEDRKAKTGPLKRLLARIRHKRTQRLEYQFMPSVMEVMDKPPAPFARVTLLLIVLLAAVAIVWSCLAEMEIVVSASGTVMPKAKVKVIQPLEPGIVTAIHVRDGQVVKKGDLLVELDSTESTADRLTLQKELLTAQVEVARLKAQIKEDPSQFQPPPKADRQVVMTHRRLLQSVLQEKKQRLLTLDRQIAHAQAEMDAAISTEKRLRRSLPLIRELYDKKKRLFQSGSLARAELIQSELELVSAQQSLEAERKRALGARANMERIRENQRLVQAEYIRRLLSELTEALKRQDTLIQQLKKADKRQIDCRLRAPVAGIVQQLGINTVGGVVTEAQPLMVIVPLDGGLEIQATVQNKDVGLIQAGQIVSVKVEAYPFTRYGALEGKLEWVGSDAIMDQQRGSIYPARISIDNYVLPNVVNDRKGRIMPGMAVTVDIKVGKRRVIEYFLTPILRYKDRSLRES